MIGAVLHLLDVGAGGEGALAARDHDRADIGIGLEIVQRLLQLGDQLRRTARSAPSDG